jgi:hypothetical protein
MSFTGDLEHLPIVDVIQLLNATRKSGVLGVRGRKGESQLVFMDGYIISASHLNNTLRIGQVLVERGAITEDNLERALEEQSKAGSKRKPLIGTLLEMGLVEEKDAYAGLQSLIEMTIVEILTWKRGTFVLDTGPAPAADGYQYCPRDISREISIDTQGVLMDSLRIFDEKMRDGELSLEDDAEEEPEITEDDLGLADLDQMERRIPGVFVSLDDRPTESVHAAKEVAAKEPEINPVRRLNEVIAALPRLRSAPEVAQAQLGYVGDIFERALTLVVRQGETIAEKGIGIKTSRVAGVVPVPGIRIPLAESSILRQAVESGCLYCGSEHDEAFKKYLLDRIGAPVAEKILLLPVRSSGKTIFLTYADFGSRPEREVPVELLNMLAAQTGQALENLSRRRLKQKETGTDRAG